MRPQPRQDPSGVCGCNEPDVDSDGDGVLDCNDGCPTDSSKLDPGQCGCDQVDTADCTQPCICDWNAGTCECNPEVQDRLDAFDQFDVDQSGTLDAAELQTLIDNKCDREPCPTAQEFLLGDAEEGRPGADQNGDGLLNYDEWVDFIRTDFENSGGCECDATDTCDIAADGEACECDPQCFECPEEQPKACEQGDGFPICVGAEQACPPVNCNNAGTECPGESVCTGMSAHCASSCDAETDCADGFHCWFEQGVCVPDGDVEVAWVECAPGDDTACSDGQFCFEFRECVDVCAQDSDCQEGYGCEPERGVCRPLDDRICPPDQPVRCDNDDGSFFCISDGERCDGGLVCQVGEISVSIQTVIHSVIGVRSAHLLDHKPAQHLEQMTSATLAKPASRCTVNVSIPVIPIRGVPRAFVM